MYQPQKSGTNSKAGKSQSRETAMATATMRALAAVEEREEIRGPDYLAKLFLTEDRKNLLKDAAVRKWVMKNKIAAGMYEFMIARTAFFDDVVEQAIREIYPQLVFLGAGYDTRPYRFKHLIKDTRIFELDLEPTQRRKKELLKQAGIDTPEHLIFVPINFDTEKLKDVLTGAGFNTRQKTLFVWEGVTYYLSAEAVDNTLSFIASYSPAGSSICFDYASLSKEALDEKGVRKLRKLMESDHSDEPTRLGIKEERLKPFLSERGYEIIEELAPREMESRYLMLRDGSSAGKVPSLFRLVHASVTAKSR